MSNRKDKESPADRPEDCLPNATQWSRLALDCGTPLVVGAAPTLVVPHRIQQSIRSAHHFLPFLSHSRDYTTIGDSKRPVNSRDTDLNFHDAPTEGDAELLPDGRGEVYETGI